MEKMFCLGLAVGAIAGALIVSNSFKARSLVKKSQCEIMEKMDEMMSEKLGSDNSSKSEKDKK